MTHPMNPVSVGDDLVERLKALIAEEAADHADDAAAAIERGERPDLWEREITIPVAALSEAASQLAAVTAANNALIAERTSIIATKRKQIASLMDERNNLADIVNSGIDDVAGAKLDELEERATTAEAQLKAAREALERQRDNIDRWLETGIAAGPEESKSIYDQICAALNPKAPS